MPNTQKVFLALLLDYPGGSAGCFEEQSFGKGSKGGSKLVLEYASAFH